MKIPVVLCIDVEPDDRLINPSVQKDWIGFESTFEIFSKLRPRIEAATGSPVHLSWFFRMDPQIAITYGSASWAVMRYESLIREIKRAGDAIGLHAHSWRLNETRDKWIVDFADQDWINHCVGLGFEAFRQSLNESCLYFRFGDHWMNNATSRLIEKLGARFDLTLEPGQTGGHVAEPFTGDFLDYSQVPRRPYISSRTDFRKHGSYPRKLWTIPLSVGPEDWAPMSSNEAESKPRSLSSTDQTALSLSQVSASKPHPSHESYEGYLDRADCEFISGWAYDKSRPEIRIEVEICEGDHPLTTAIAATFRQDLLAAGKGDGRHSFNVPVPTWLKNGKPHSINVKVAGTRFCLNNSPRELTCYETNSSKCLTLDLAFNPWSMCRIVDTLMTGSHGPYLAIVGRSDIPTHPDRLSNMDQTINYLLGHPLIGQMVFETPAEMIRRLR